MMATLASTISSDSPSTALIIPATAKSKAFEVSYRQLYAEVQSFQQKLAGIGISPQAAVSIALPNSYAFVIAFLAASWQRAIAAPLNPAYKQDEFEFYIDDLSSAVTLVPRGAFSQDAAAVRAAKKYKAAIAECYFDGQHVVLDIKDAGKLAGQGDKSVEQSQPDDVALVLHTSGTTGRPKAVPLTHRNLTTTMRNIKASYALSSNDRNLLVMPLFHVHGLLAGLLAPLYSSGSIIVPPRFSASEFWSAFTTHNANWYTAVPTIHQILLRNPLPSPLPKIRFIRSCSSPLSPKVFHELEAKLHAPVLEAYAMTEAAHQMTTNPLPPAKRFPGSVGLGHGVEVAILNDAGSEVPRGKEGEICIRGPNVTKGYLNNPSANASSFTSSGFFRTGDQGTMDAQGYIRITGRIKELINKGGEKISPIEIDNLVASHPAVAEAVSFAIEDEVYGQDVGVAVVLKKGEERGEKGEMGAEDVRDWVKRKAAKFKIPRKVYFTDVMPKTATGKVQRRMVAKEMEGRERKTAKL